MMKYLLSILCLLFVANQLNAQPSPGDWFKEYHWTMPSNENNADFLRVGGKLDYRINTPSFDEGHYKGGNILINHEVDLKNAIRAELMVEKLLCHDYTTGLAVSINSNDYIIFPEAEGIPEPQEGYMHHFYPVVAVPLSQLTSGTKNFFQLKVDSTQHWNWPQNMVYGLTLRVYYKAPKDKYPQVKLASNTIILNQKIELSYSNEQNIEKVEYLGKYFGLNMEGDGIYTQWHYNWYRNEVKNHIGTANKAPYNVNWENEWIPDQKNGFALAARVHFGNGLIYFTKALTGLTLERDYSVGFSPPYNIPNMWLTRNGEQSSSFYLNGSAKNVNQLKVVWRSWSAGYMNGLYLNDYLFFIREGYRYAYQEHEIIMNDCEVLNPGINEIKTGKTPRYNWEMVHGAEILYPGPMVLVKYHKGK